MNALLPRAVIPDLIRDPCAKTTTGRAVLGGAVLPSCVGSVPNSRGLPGGNSLFFCVAKRKVSKRKGDPAVCDPCASLRGNLRCSVQPGPGSNSLRSDNRPSLSVWTSAPRRSQKGGGVGSGLEFGPAIGLRRGRALRVLASPHPNPSLFPHPLGWAEERRQERTRASDCLSRRRVRARPRFCRAPQVARSEAEGPRLSGRLSFGYFSLATQRKVPRPPGRDPACRQSADLRVEDDSRPSARRRK